MQPKKHVSYCYNENIGNFYYGKEHPMKPYRIRMTHSLIMNYGLYRKMDVYCPNKLSVSELTNFHSEEYVRFLQSVNPENVGEFKKQMSLFGVDKDCPIFDGMFEFSQLSAAGTVLAAMSLNKGSSDICINWGGGLHHAKKSCASGFCYINDVVLGILELLKYHKRVLYIDIDVHHGDGVEEAFYTTDRVMTLSFHKYGNYFPGTGSLQEIGTEKGLYHAINVPLYEGMNDDCYEQIFSTIVSKVIETYQPNAIVLQCGADSLADDRLGCFNLTTKGHGKCVEFVKSFNVPLMLLGGGGYTPRNVCRAWTYETAIAIGVDIENDLPYNDFFEYFRPHYKLHTQPEKVANYNNTKYLERVKEKIFENLRQLTKSPSVQIQPIVPDAIVNISDSEDETVRKRLRLDYYKNDYAGQSTTRKNNYLWKD